MNLNNLIIDRAFIEKNKNTKKDYVYTLLVRLNKSGKTNKIMKGKYTNQTDIYSIATNLFSPSYLSFWSASYFNGFTEQIVNEVQVVVTKRHKKINFQNYTINFVVLNKKDFFGFKKIKYGEYFIFVADNEKLIIDSLLKEKLLGNFDEIIKIIKNTQIDKEKMIEYLNRINNKSLNKKIGYLLDQYKNLDLSKEINYLDNNYVKLSSLKTTKLINKKWRVKI